MESIKKKVHIFLKERGWDKQTLDNVAKSISIEAAELLEHFQWNDYSIDDIKKNPAKLDEIGMELADILIYCAEIAIMLDYDPEKLIDAKLASAAKKYPVGMTKDKLGSEEYWKIKKEYRKRS